MNYFISCLDKWKMIGEIKDKLEREAYTLVEAQQVYNKYT